MEKKSERRTKYKCIMGSDTSDSLAYKRIKENLYIYMHIHKYIYIYIYIITVLVVTKSLCGFVSNQVQYNNLG